MARLATVDGHSNPHLVPIVFVARGDVVVTAVDHKPKRSRSLKRLANIEGNPSVSILVDRYDEDWSLLWWVRVDGTAQLVREGSEFEEAVDLLVAKYPQYAAAVPSGPVVWIDAVKWRSWSAAGS